MNRENEGQTIPEFVELLKQQENHSRTKRRGNMIRLFGEAGSESTEKRFELKDSAKINIKMVRQYRYDEVNEKIQLKSIPCICENCLQGNFNSCNKYNQVIIETDIIDYHSPPQRRPNSNLEAEEIEAEEIEDFGEFEILRQNDNIDINFLNNNFESYPQSKNPSPRQNKSPDSADECIELSSPNPDHVTSTQEQTVEFEDFGSIDDNDDQSDGNYIAQRLKCMSQRDCLEPTRFLNDRECLEAILDSEGWLYGFSLNYLSHMISKQNSSNEDCSFLKTEIARWLNAPVKERLNWNSLLIGKEKIFQNSKRIIVPWHKNGNHWTVFHFDSNLKIIECFDSLHEPPYLCDMKKITNFLRVSTLLIHVILTVGFK